MKLIGQAFFFSLAYMAKESSNDARRGRARNVSCRLQRIRSHKNSTIICRANDLNVGSQLCSYTVVTSLAFSCMGITQKHSTCTQMCSSARCCDRAGNRYQQQTLRAKGERDVWDQGGEAFSTGDCPRWTQAAPSLYKQPASLLCQSPLVSFVPLVHNSAPAETVKKLTCSVPTLLLTIYLSPPTPVPKPPPTPQSVPFPKSTHH